MFEPQETNLDTEMMIEDSKIMLEKFAKLDEYEEHFLSCKKRLKDIYLDLAEYTSDGELSPHMAADFRDKILSIMNESKTLFFLTYKLFSDVNYVPLGVTGDRVLLTDFHKDFKEFLPVKLIVSDNKIYVKLPLLWSKYNVHAGKKHGDNLSFFKSELQSEIYKNYDEICSIPNMSFKHFSYLFVVPSTLSVPADSDNYDTKYVTDLLSNTLLCGDSALSCTFSYYSIMENSLPEGTYIMLDSSFGNPPKIDVLKDEFQRIFS